MLSKLLILSHHYSFCCQHFLRISVFSNESALHFRWSKHLLHLQHHSFHWIMVTWSGGLWLKKILFKFCLNNLWQNNHVTHFLSLNQMNWMTFFYSLFLKKWNIVESDQFKSIWLDESDLSVIINEDILERSLGKKVPLHNI